MSETTRHINTGQIEAGRLYVVSTPIGNLEDMTARAVATLKAVDLIAAEDTRHSKHLASHFGISTPMISLHTHNEAERQADVIAKLMNGKTVALISDAGTPLISDPGFSLVSEAHKNNIRVVPVPGASALTAALAVAGLPVERFCFEGFLPAKPLQRQKVLKELSEESRTMVFYEAPHRITACLQDISTELGSDREVVIARELTKQFETIYQGSVSEVLEVIMSHDDHRRGEFVVLVRGSDAVIEIDAKTEALLLALMEQMPLKKAAAIIAEFTGIRKNMLYEAGLKLGGKQK
jgi:16S rRNA (cytidine1402-2'-O)-methyltransferase